MGAGSKRLANQIVAVGGAFLMVVGFLNFIGACDPIILAAVGSAVDEKTPEEWQAEMRADAAKRRAAREADQDAARREVLRKSEESEPRAIGAWYPDEHPDREPDVLTTVDPALIAIGGGALVFGLVGGVAWVLFGTGRAPAGHSSASSAPSSAIEPSGPESDGPT